jgi:hypothetical protein
MFFGIVYIIVLLILLLLIGGLFGQHEQDFYICMAILWPIVIIAVFVLSIVHVLFVIPGRFILRCGSYLGKRFFKIDAT